MTMDTSTPSQTSTKRTLETSNGDNVILKRYKPTSPLHFEECQPQSCSASYYNAAYISDLVETMKNQESNVYRPFDYIDGATVTCEDRRGVCEWGYQIVDEFELDRHIAVVAVTYLDRFLSCRGLRVVEICLDKRREFQLAFIVCLIIALKGRENMDVTPKFVCEKLCDGMYHTEEVINMEIEILRCLGWRLSGPTPQDFLHCFMQLLPSSADEELANMFMEAAMEQVENAMLDYEQALQTSSSLALASFASLMHSLDSDAQQRLDANNWGDRVLLVMGDDSNENKDMS